MAGADVVFCGTKFTLASVTAGALASNPADKQRARRVLFIFIVITSNAQVSGSQAIARRPKD
ncbi:hypothetical protein TUM16664_00610 [Enterobacter cloacae]|nr:hypothetical protein TUM16664_00610 [Enterobacter cloacae]